MKIITSILAIGMVISASSFSVQASNNQGNNAGSKPAGPFVECLLPSGAIEFMPAMFCEIKKGKYHY